MDRHPIESIMTTTMESIRDMIDVNTIIGDAIPTADGCTVIPISRVTLGFGTGGTSGSKGISFTGGNGGGVKVEPIGFFVIKDGNCRMISVAPPPLTTMDRIVEMMPDVLDKVDGIVNKNKEE